VTPKLKLDPDSLYAAITAMAQPAYMSCREAAHVGHAKRKMLAETIKTLAHLNAKHAGQHLQGIRPSECVIHSAYQKT
jgi:hypothetical protein